MFKMTVLDATPQYINISTLTGNQLVILTYFIIIWHLL